MRKKPSASVFRIHVTVIQVLKTRERDSEGDDLLCTENKAGSYLLSGKQLGASPLSVGEGKIYALDKVNISSVKWINHDM